MGATVSNDGFFWTQYAFGLFVDRVPSNIEKALDRFGSRLRWEVGHQPQKSNCCFKGMAEELEFQVERVLSVQPSGLATSGAKFVG